MHSANVHSGSGSDHAGGEAGEAPDLSRLRLRAAFVLTGVLLILLIAFVPPLINVSRFQRRIASNLSASLGRPVHLDRVTLSLLPLPGFTLENFVVDEDPAFGYEPILRANEVRATVRISSLWSHRVEFSRISLTEPTSVNLVRLPNGRWNFESVLIQASHIEAAPTAQSFSGPAPRFPYIEADGARLNFKFGDEKTPLALTDSEFSLWLPGARQWHFRLKAHPARTDAPPSDAGLLRLEGTLGGSQATATTLADVPIDLRANWDPAPLAGLSRLLLGRDAGLRGSLSLDVHASGTAGQAALASHLSLNQVRRSDFIPSHLISLEATCRAMAGDSFQSVSAIQCRWPSNGTPLLTASGAIPEIGDPRTASADLILHAIPAARLLDWLQAATPHPPSGLEGNGVVAGALSWKGTQAPGQSAWSGGVELSGESIRLPPSETSSAVPIGYVLLRSTSQNGSVSPGERRPAPRATQPPVAEDGFDLLPVSIPLGGRQPALLEAHFDAAGYTLHLTGSATLNHLLELAKAIPQLGDGLESALAPAETGAFVSPQPQRTPSDQETIPIRLDLTAIRLWGHPQVWAQTGSRPHP